LNLDKKKSVKKRDLISNADTESTASSSDVPLGDRLPLAMLTTKLPPLPQLPQLSQLSQSPQLSQDDDDDTTPLGRRINSFGATSNSHLDKSDYNHYDSVLSEVLDICDYHPPDVDKISEDDYPIGKRLSDINKEKERGIFSDEEIPIGQLNRI